MTTCACEPWNTWMLCWVEFGWCHLIVSTNGNIKWVLRKIFYKVIFFTKLYFSPSKHSNNSLSFHNFFVTFFKILYLHLSWLVRNDLLWSATAGRFSASDLCSDGWVVRMWDRTPTATVVLVSLSKTLYHNWFSPPRSGMGTCESRVGCVCLISPICAVMAAIELCTPQGAEMVSGMIYVPDEQG